MSERGRRGPEMDRERKLYNDYIDAGVKFALAKIDQEGFGLQQAVHVATQSLRLPTGAFHMVRSFIQSDVQRLRGRVKEQDPKATKKALASDHWITGEMIEDARRLEEENTTEEELIEREQNTDNSQ